MADVLNPELDDQLTSVYNGFSNLYRILIDAYEQDLVAGGNPDVEGLKALRREFVELTDYIADNSNLVFTLPGGIEVLGMNKYKLTSQQLGSTISRLKDIFRLLVLETQSYSL